MLAFKSRFDLMPEAVRDVQDVTRVQLAGQEPDVLETREHLEIYLQTRKRIKNESRRMTNYCLICYVT